MQYLYCLVRKAKGIDTFPPGLAGSKVYQILFRRIGALVSDITHADLASSAENALVHHRIIQRALELSSSVIPCRFGMSFAHAEEVVSLLRRNYPKLESYLAKLKGKVEVGVRVILDGRVTWEGKQVGGKLPDNLTQGERYLLEKKERYHMALGLSAQAQSVTQALNRATSPFWADVKAEKKHVHKNDLILSLLYLIDKEKLSSFKRAYEQFRKASSGLKLLITGPWPAYSFADFALDKGGEEGM